MATERVIVQRQLLGRMGCDVVQHVVIGERAAKARTKCVGVASADSAGEFEAVAKLFDFAEMKTAQRFPSSRQLAGAKRAEW